MATFPADPGAYTPPLSLWQLVEQHVPCHEHDEIKSMLGESLVDQTVELHNEIKLLLEIWQDYRRETETEHLDVCGLAEPPHVRERLIQEICFLADNIRERSLLKGMDPDNVLSKHNSKVLVYAEDAKRSGSPLSVSRPQSARSSEGRQTPLSPTSLVTSRQSLSAAISNDVESTNAKLNVLEFTDVCDRLRATLQKEMKQLEADVAFLQSSLDEEAHFRNSGSFPSLFKEPTITELREERTLLEKEFQSSELIPATPKVTRPAFEPMSSSGKMQIRPVSAKLRSNHTRTSLKTMPLKATHDLILSVTTPALADSIPDKSKSTDVRTDSSKSSCERPIHTHRGSANMGLLRFSPSYRGGAELDFFTPLHEDKHTSEPGLVRPAHAESATSTISLTDLSSSASGISSTLLADQHREGGRGDVQDKKIKGQSSARRPTVSSGRIQVVPVGSIKDLHRDSEHKHFIPAPPFTEKSQISRPSSAERFRKFVLQCRDGN